MATNVQQLMDFYSYAWNDNNLSVDKTEICYWSHDTKSIIEVQNILVIVLS